MSTTGPMICDDLADFRCAVMRLIYVRVTCLDARQRLAPDTTSMISRVIAA